MMYLLIIFFSLCFGSFMNVVICRYPQMLMHAWKKEAENYLGINSTHLEKTNPMNLAYPSSRCPACQQALSWWQNIPLLSFFILRGRCAHCHAKISWQYPLVEVLAALTALICFEHFDFTGMSFFATLLSWGLITQAVIDYHEQILPDTITYALLWLGLLVSTTPLSSVGPTASIMGAVIGYGLLWIIATAFQWLRKKEGMGQGDLKLLALLGAWMGPALIPLTLMIASVLSLVVFVCLWLAKKINRDTPLPFGPFLAFGGWICFLWGAPLWQAWARLL